MKNLLIAALAATATAMSASADVTTVKTLFSESKAVTWENTLMIEGAEFENDVNVGDYILVNLENARETIEFKSNGTWLPGSAFTNIEGKSEVKCYLTADGLATLKATGLELCGSSFTVTGVSVCNDGFQMPEGAVWGGYFWVDNWNTLEVWKTAFEKYDGQKYMVINISDDNGDNTGYFMKVLTRWDPETDWFVNEKITKTEHYAMCAFSDNSLGEESWNMGGALEGINSVMFQANPEGGNPFNITSIVLTNDDNIWSGLSVVSVAGDNAPVDVYSIDGRRVRTSIDASAALENLPAGLYISNGRKYIVK